MIIPTDCKVVVQYRQCFESVMDNLEVQHLISLHTTHSKAEKKSSDAAMSIPAKAVAKQFLVSYSFYNFSVPMLSVIMDLIISQQFSRLAVLVI